MQGTDPQDRMQMLEWLAQRKRQLKEVQEATAEQMAEVDDAIRAICPEPGRYQAGAAEVTLQPNRRLDAKALEETYPPDACPELWRQVPNTQAIKSVLSPADYDALMRPVGANKVLLT